MTTDEFIKKMDKQIADIVTNNKPLLFGVRNVMALQSKRIFIDGKNSQGNTIGSYIKRDYYINPVTFGKQGGRQTSFPLKGKYGETKFKNGEPHKTGYFGSFLEFKRAISLNKNIGTVDLFLTGELHRHYANAEVRGKAEAKKLNAHNYYVAISETDVKKVARYGKIFNLTLLERKALLTTVRNELTRALK